MRVFFLSFENAVQVLLIAFDLLNVEEIAHEELALFSNVDGFEEITESLGVIVISLFYNGCGYLAVLELKTLVIRRGEYEFEGLFENYKYGRGTFFVDFVDLFDTNGEKIVSFVVVENGKYFFKFCLHFWILIIWKLFQKLINYYSISSSQAASINKFKIRKSKCDYCFI